MDGPNVDREKFNKYSLDVQRIPSAGDYVLCTLNKISATRRPLIARLHSGQSRSIDTNAKRTFIFPVRSACVMLMSESRSDAQTCLRRYKFKKPFNLYLNARIIIIIRMHVVSKEFNATIMVRKASRCKKCLLSQRVCIYVLTLENKKSSKNARRHGWRIIR